MKKFLSLFVVSMLINALAFAQNQTVKGRVTDENGRPLLGISVQVKGNTIGTATDANGMYELEVPSDATLVFTGVGYREMSVAVNGRATIDVAMTSSAKELGTVVVTALGIQTKNDNLTTSQSRVTGSSIVSSGENNVLNGLASKASGVQIISSGGEPGSSAYMQIRGQSTITGNLQPLFVVDGIPVSNSSLGNDVQNTTVQQSRISDLNPDNIASVDILKGAAAAALYGSRAANGVVLITTKKGKASGGKVNISLLTTYSLDVLNRSAPLQTTFGQGTGGRYKFGDRLSWGDKIADRTGGADDYLTGGDYVIFPDGTRRYRIANGDATNPHGGKNSKEIFDHRKDVFHNGHYLNNTLAFSGGDEKTVYYASVSNFDQQGIFVKRSDYHRNSFNVNAQRKFNKVLTISSNAEYSFVKSNRVQQGSNVSGIFLGGLRTPPDFDNTQYVGDYVDAAGVIYPNRQVAYRNPIGASTNSIYDNPFWILNNITSTTNVNRFLGSLEFNVTATPWLSFLSRTGIDYYNDDRENNYPVISSAYPGGDLVIEQYSEQEFNTDLIARVNTPLNKNIEFDGLLGVNYNNRTYKNVGADVKGFILPDAPFNLENSAGAARTPFNRKKEVRSSAAYAQLGFTLYDQLIIDLTGRAEYPSTVSKTFFFPSASIAWQFSKLKSMENASWLSFGKLRASYGEVGVEPEAYLNRTYYLGAGALILLESYGPSLDASSPIYGGGYVRNTLKGNPDLAPERKKEVEGGLDLRFLQDRLSLSATVYSNKTTGAILPVQVAASTGYINMDANAASIQNRGVELDFGFNWFKPAEDKLQISTNIIWSKNKNKVLDLNGTKQIGLSGFTGVISSAVPGYGLGAFWGVGYDRDANGNLILDENGFPTVAPTESVLGDPNPDWTGAISTTFSYKKVNLRVLFDHVQGGQVWNGTRAALTTMGTAAETGTEVTAPTDLTAYDGSVIPAGTTFRGSIGDFGAGPVALTQAWYSDIGGGFGSATGPQFFESATRTRLREISLGYTISGKRFTEKTKLQSIDISLSGRNIVLWTKYKGIDPETNLEGPSNGRGIDYFNNPSTRSYLFSIKINY